MTEHVYSQRDRKVYGHSLQMAHKKHDNRSSTLSLLLKRYSFFTVLEISKHSVHKTEQDTTSQQTTILPAEKGKIQK